MHARVSVGVWIITCSHTLTCVRNACLLVWCTLRLYLYPLHAFVSQCSCPLYCNSNFSSLLQTAADADGGGWEQQPKLGYRYANRVVASLGQRAGGWVEWAPLPPFPTHPYSHSPRAVNRTTIKRGVNSLPVFGAAWASEHPFPLVPKAVFYWCLCVFLCAFVKRLRKTTTR